MACPFKRDFDENPPSTESRTSDHGILKEVKDGLDYSTYLKLGPLLNLQEMVSKEGGSKPGIHDEHLFIVTHQTYELWFKQIIHEIDSIRDLFKMPVLDESKTLLVTRRMNRIILIMKVLVDQFNIIETMTPHDFMDFRHHLSRGSGFQSFQFRILENKLGLKDANRVKYNQEHYKSVFSGETAADVDTSSEEDSLFIMVQKWLERTPGLEGELGLWEKYQEAALGWINENFLRPAEEETDPEEKKVKMADYKKQMDAYNSMADAEGYNVYLARGDRRLSYKAFQGAIFISLYRDEPRFHQPFQILNYLMDIDSMLTKWRHHHVTMVQRMIGNKLGTGGSSGYLYLRSTVSDRYKVFLDLFNLSTYLIPRSHLPPLNADMKLRLSMIA